MNKILIVTLAIILGSLIKLSYNKVFFLNYNKSEKIIVSSPEKEILLWRVAAESKDPYSMYIYGLELLRRDPHDSEGEQWIVNAANLNQKDAVGWMISNKEKTESERKAQ